MATFVEPSKAPLPAGHDNKFVARLDDALATEVSISDAGEDVIEGAEANTQKDTEMEIDAESTLKDKSLATSKSSSGSAQTATGRWGGGRGLSF